jgi:hypothetical protein
MSREVRKVHASWQHPMWNPPLGERPGPEGEGWFIPLTADEMPQWTEDEATRFQMYKTHLQRARNTWGGTPVSPVMDSPEALAQWLEDNKPSASGDYPASYDAWLKVCRGRIITGVEDEAA